MSAELRSGTADDSVLQAYLLGTVDFDLCLRVQRRLHYEVTGDRRRAAILLCEHPYTITIGRQGSRSHVQLDPDELSSRRWPIHWVNRGGGCLLHGPGQFALYAVLPLETLGLTISEYMGQLGLVVRDLLHDFSIHSPLRTDERGLWAGDRLLAAFGVSVRDWVTGYGVYINVHPNLDLFRCVHVTPDCDLPMTSLERERRGRVRPSLVRERLIEHFRSRLGFARVVLFSDHPLLDSPGPRREALAPEGPTRC